MNDTATISSSTNSASTNFGSTKSSSTSDSLRCQHQTPSGRRCRTTIFDDSLRFCLQHTRMNNSQRDVKDLTPYLLGDLPELRSAQDMKQVLGNLFILLAQNRVSTKKAAVFTYIIQQLLRTLPAIDRELNPANKQTQIIFDLPRPIRD